MPNYTIAVTDEQDAAITARRTHEAPDVKDNATYVTATVRDRILKGVVDAFIEARVQKVADAYRQGTADQRATVDRVLGI